MGMFGTKSVIDMTEAEFADWKAAIERQREWERRFDDRTAKAVADAKARAAIRAVTEAP